MGLINCGVPSAEWGLQMARIQNVNSPQRGARSAKSKIAEVSSNVIFFICQVKQNAGSK
jgi:hypothetical protein